MTVRRAVAADIPVIARLDLATWRSTYQGIVDGDFLASRSVAESENYIRQRVVYSDPATTAVFVHVGALDIIEGFIGAGPLRDESRLAEAEIYSLYVEATRHRQGIGRRLMAAAFSFLHAAGFQDVLSWVIDNNRAGCAFYQRLGGQLTASARFKLGEQTLNEVAYVWPKIALA